MKKYLIWIVLAVVVVGGVVWLGMKDNNTAQAGKYDDFAKCLKDQGAVFYGAFWCPHCQTQKKMFGTSAKYLPYVECSTPDGNSQTAECNQKKIEGYPTWEFKDGSRLSGEIQLSTLAEKTSCTLPQ